MNCPICGKQNPDDARECQFCKATLKNLINVRVSRLATAAFIISICAVILAFQHMFTRLYFPTTFLLSGIISLIALIIGLISYIRIEASGGSITGSNFAVATVLISVFSVIAPVSLFLTLSYIRNHAYRMVCGTNLSGIGKAMMLYANDHDDKFPRAGGKETVWANKISDWKAQNRFAAYGLADDGSGGAATISSSFYLLVRYENVEPKTFVCDEDSKIKEFVPSKYGVSDKGLTEFCDFGPEPWKHYSYSYHMPYGGYALTTLSKPEMAVAADRNPWIVSPAGKVKDFKLFDPNGDRNAIMAGNSPSHQNDHQNVLFVDIHVSMEKTSACGANDDNIYTSWDGDDIRRGIPPKPGSQPADKLDSLLLNEPPIKKP